MNGIRIRAAVGADARRIAQVHVQAWRESYRVLVPGHVIEALSVERNVAMWADILSRSDSSVVHIVEQLGTGGVEVELVGFGAAANAPSPELGARGEITAIYLLDQIKRRGIGRMLLSGLLAALAARGHRSAGVWVLFGNHGARRLYETLGARLGPQRLITDGPAQMHEIAYFWDDLSAFTPHSSPSDSAIENLDRLANSI